MPKALSNDVLLQTIEAVRQAGGNQCHAGAALGIGQVVINQRLRTARNRGLVTLEQEAEWRSRESFTSGRRLPQTSDECHALLADFIGRSQRSKIQAPKPRACATRRIVIASDFHAPFQDNEAVASLIAREAKISDRLIIGGDFTDSYAYSRFVKYERITAEAEWAACDALLAQLSAAFPEVICLSGNHDARLERHLRAQLSPDVMFAVEQLTGGVLDPFQAIAKRYKNVRFQGHQAGRHGIGWFAQFGDLIVSHAEKFSRVPGSALRSIDEWFSDQDTTLGLKPWRVLIQEHTHQLGMFAWKSNRLLVEGGCLCSTHGYQLQPRISGRPQRHGYVRLEQSQDGTTDINSVRLVWLDADRQAA